MKDFIESCKAVIKLVVMFFTLLWVSKIDLPIRAIRCHLFGHGKLETDDMSTITYCPKCFKENI